VLIPGVSGAKELFDSLAPRLSGDRPVLSLDLSHRVVPGSTVIDSAVEDTVELLDDLGITSADVLGQSFGSVLAVRLWRRGRVRRLILAPPAVVPRRGPLLFFHWFVTGTAVRLWPVSREKHLRRFIGAMGGYTPEPDVEGEEFANLIRRVKRVRVRSLLRRMLALRTHSWQRELEGVTAPVLIIEGEREVATVPAALLSFFRTRAATKVAIVPGGHMPFLAHPTQFQETVLQFLEGDP
jgi:pimeloyl-ACP methyl ester carboxylesterase